MHDLDEGSWNYGMCLLILKLIELKRFTIDELNNRIQGFDYGYCEASNRSGILEIKNFKKRSFPFTAAETLCFVRYFGLMIGDYITAENKELWRFYEVIVEIVNIVLSPTVRHNDKIFLKGLITEHHSLYLKLFPNETNRNITICFTMMNVVKKSGLYCLCHAGGLRQNIDHPYDTLLLIVATKTCLRH